MKRKIYTAVLMLLFTLSLTFMFACEKDEEKNGQETQGVIYTLSDDGGQYICAGVGDGDIMNIVIAEEYEGLPVRIVGENAFANSSITQITIPASITTFEKGAFYKCKNLERVDYLGDIEEWAKINFDGINASPVNSAGSIYINDNLVTKIELKGEINIGSYALSGFKKVTELIIPESVSIIGENAFQYSTFQKVTAPCKVFGGYNLLQQYFEKVVINGGDKIPTQAFYYATNLVEITIPSTVVVIEENAFLGCNKINTVNYLGTVEQWATINFADADANPLPYAERMSTVGNEDTREIELNNVNYVSDYAFLNCGFLRKVTLGNNVVSVGKEAFYKCEALVEVVMKNVNTLGVQAFAHCKSLKTLVVNGNISQLASHTFYGCVELNSVVLSKNIRTISYGAFMTDDKISIVYYMGTIDDATNITIGGENVFLKRASWYYYSEEEPTDVGNFWHYVNGVPTVWII